MPQRPLQSKFAEHPVKQHVRFHCWSPADNKKLLWIRISPFGLKKLFTDEFIIFNYPALNPHLRYLPKENEGMHASKHLCCALFNSASRRRLKCYMLLCASLCLFLSLSVRVCAYVRACVRASASNFTDPSTAGWHHKQRHGLIKQVQL